MDAGALRAASYRISAPRPRRPAALIGPRGVVPPPAPPFSPPRPPGVPRAPGMGVRGQGAARAGLDQSVLRLGLEKRTRSLSSA